MQARRPGGTLAQVVKQPYGVCCLTGHAFKGVQWGDKNSMKLMSRNISRPLSLVYSDFVEDAELLSNKSNSQ